MSPEPYTVKLDPDSNTTLKMYLFKNVENVKDIREHIVKGEWNCSIVKPSLILSPFQIAIAANKSVVSEIQKTMVTKTVYAEILYNLSLSKNISQSLSKFGIETDRNLLVCFLIKDQDKSAEIIAKINGDLCSIDELVTLRNIDDIKSVYKLNKLDIKCEENLLDIVISRITTKNFVIH